MRAGVFVHVSIEVVPFNYSTALIQSGIINRFEIDFCETKRLLMLSIDSAIRIQERYWAQLWVCVDAKLIQLL